MPGKTKINLLPKADFESSNAGKLLNWITSVGRWIVVLTEFVVICAFLSRFYFDTKLSNLFDALRQKKAIVDSALAFERDFLVAQEKIKIVKNLLKEEKKPSALINQISRLVPLDVTLTAIQIEKDKLTIRGYSLSEQGINLFLTQVKKQPNLSQINLGAITQKSLSPGINFEVSAVIKK